MAKVVRFFRDKARAKAFIAEAKKKYRGVQGGSVYDIGGKYHAMIYGEFGPDVELALQGKSQQT